VRAQCQSEEDAARVGVRIRSALAGEGTAGRSSPSQPAGACAASAVMRVYGSDPHRACYRDLFCCHHVAIPSAGSRRRRAVTLWCHLPVTAWQNVWTPQLRVQRRLVGERKTTPEVPTVEERMPLSTIAVAHRASAFRSAAAAHRQAVPSFSPSPAAPLRADPGAAGTLRLEALRAYHDTGTSIRSSTPSPSAAPGRGT